MARLQATVLVFARRPCAGKVKRRLAHALGRRAAAACYAALLERTLNVVDAVDPLVKVLLPAAPADVAYFRRRLAGTRWRVRAQVTGDLGARMAGALASTQGNGPRGHAAAVLIGSDLLDVEPADLWRAGAALAAASDVAIGPAQDGGYWLIGTRAPQPELFDAMQWSQRTVCGVTAARCAAAGLAFTMLAPPRADLDRGCDLVRGRGARLRALRSDRLKWVRCE